MIYKGQLIVLRVSVLAIVKPTHVNTSSIVSAHTGDSFRIVDRILKVIEILSAHGTFESAVPSEWIGTYSLLRFITLDIKEPLPSETLVGSMAKFHLIGPSTEFDFGNEERHGIYEIFAFDLHFRFTCVYAVQGLTQIIGGFSVESGAYPSNMDQTFSAIGSKQQTTELAHCNRRLFISDDEEALALNALDLDPVTSASGAIVSIEVLCNYPKAKRAGICQ